MKTLPIIMLALLLVGCHATTGQATKGQTITANLDPNLTRTYAWPETGLTITLLQGWRRDDDGSDKDERSWITFDNSKFKVSVSTAVSSLSIEDDTTHYYKTQVGSEDLRYVNVDGATGVHFLRDAKSVDFNPIDEKWIFWSGQRLWGDQRQLINIVLTTPKQSFEKNRDLLYSLLASVKFDSNKNTTIGNETPATDPSHDVVVSIPSENAFYLGKHIIERAQIAGEVDKLLRDRTVDKQTWYLKVLTTVSCETVLKLRDDIAALGYEKVGFVSDQKTSAPKITSARQERSSTPQTKQEPESHFDVYVGLSKTGGTVIKVNETEIPQNQLVDQVRNFLRSHPNKGIIITVASNVSYGSLISIIDELKAGGAESIGIGLEH